MEREFFYGTNSWLSFGGCVWQCWFMAGVVKVKQTILKMLLGSVWGEWNYMGIVKGCKYYCFPLTSLAGLWLYMTAIKIKLDLRFLIFFFSYLEIFSSLSIKAKILCARRHMMIIVCVYPLIPSRWWWWALASQQWKWNLNRKSEPKYFFWRVILHNDSRRSII